MTPRNNEKNNSFHSSRHALTVHTTKSRERCSGLLYYIPECIGINVTRPSSGWCARRADENLGILVYSRGLDPCIPYHKNVNLFGMLRGDKVNIYH